MVEDSIRIAGGKRLEGTVQLNGSKNGTLPLLAATLLVDGESLIHNVPKIEDVFTMVDLLGSLGLDTQWQRGSLLVRNRGLSQHRPPQELMEKMRASFYVFGPLLARLGKADVPLPGGCNLGSRPVDYIIKEFLPLGARIQVEHGYVLAEARQLQGATINLDPRYRSPGATFNLLMGAVLARGTTVIHNACGEPDVVEFCRFLRAAGARIEGEGTPVLRVDGVARLQGCEITAPNDRLEAGTYLLAAAITGGDVTVRTISPGAVGVLLERLAEAGMEIRAGSDHVRCVGGPRPGSLHVETAPFPGFPTDLQPPLVAMLCLGEGRSVVKENIYDGRLAYLDQLARMGARCHVDDRVATIEGVEKLTGARVQAERHMRAGAALVLAALAAEGESEIVGKHFIERGYQNFEQKLAHLGAQVLSPREVQ